MSETHAPVLTEVAGFLETCRTAALATADAAGRPHATNVQFATDEALRFYWVSSPDSLHSRHLAARPEAALAIYAHDDRALNIHGVQLSGKVRGITHEGEANDAFELYTTKFTFTVALPQFREQIERQRFYVFTPTWLRWIDNRRGFGFKRELTLNP